MSNKFIQLILLLVISTGSFAQCEVKSFKINDQITRYSMTEQFYRNQDLENGMKIVNIYANSFKDVSTKRVILNNLVVTYVFSGYQREFAPGILVINLANGNTVNLKAKEKSTNTINELPSPSSIKTIEGIFELTGSDVTSIKESSISLIYIRDTRQDANLDITPKYKSILLEMLNCVNN